MQRIRISAGIEEFSMDGAPVMNATAVIPTVRSAGRMKYGSHAYYFLDFRNSRGLCVSISHGDIVRPGFQRFVRAATGAQGASAAVRSMIRRYHYGFSFLEEIMLMTVPHTVTDMCDGTFLVNLWSYYGHLVVDPRGRNVTYNVIDETAGNMVLGSRQCLDGKSGSIYFMTFSLDESLARISDPSRPVSASINRRKAGSDSSEPVWSGHLADFLHDVIVSGDGRYWAACELGMYINDNKEIVPSRVLVADAGDGSQRQWRLDRFIVAAHAQFDPEEQDIIYFSNHNFEFRHTPLLKLLKNATYAVKFRGPASIFKYRITSDGPREVGVFTRSDFFRLTNMHVFFHRGRKMMAAMGFPDEIFLIDPAKMEFIGKINVNEPSGPGSPGSGAKTMIGTMTPSPDGDKLFVQTTKSFQVVDIDTGRPDYVYANGHHHSCSNHMLASPYAGWA